MSVFKILIISMLERTYGSKKTKVCSIQICLKCMVYRIQTDKIRTMFNRYKSVENV